MFHLLCTFSCQDLRMGLLMVSLILLEMEFVVDGRVTVGEGAVGNDDEI